MQAAVLRIWNEREEGLTEMTCILDVKLNLMSRCNLFFVVSFVAVFILEFDSRVVEGFSSFGSVPR
jgi:hypothetical protein